MNIRTSSDVDALASSFVKAIHLVEELPNLTNDDRQKLRMLAWEYYLPMLAEAQVVQSIREVQTLRQWYELPSTENFVI